MYFVSIRNSITITFVESSDGGAWSIRPKSVRLMDPAPKMTPWCNFTVVVKMDDDDVDAAAAEELQSDQADDDYHPHLFSTPSLHPEEEESDFPIADDDVSGSITLAADGEPQSPSFIRIKKMEAVMSQVKPAGSTVTYKCPADGMCYWLVCFEIYSRSSSFTSTSCVPSRNRISQTGDSVDEGWRSDQTPPGLGQVAKMVAGAGGGHHLRFGKLHLHRVQLARLRLVYFQTSHSR